MAWREIGGGTYVKWEEKGQQVEGAWQGLKEGKRAPDGKVTQVGVVLTERGPLRFSATSVLQDRLGGLEVGVLVRITYLGKDRSQSGTEFKAFRVEIDETPF